MGFRGGINITIKEKYNRIYWDIETTGLDPYIDFITAICFNLNNEKHIYHISDFKKEDQEYFDAESDMLDEVLNFIEEYNNNSIFIGFNSTYFDVDFLTKRANIHCYDVYPHKYQRRNPNTHRSQTLQTFKFYGYDVFNNVDILELMQSLNLLTNRETVSLQRLAVSLGLEGKTQSNITDWLKFATEDRELFEEYLIQDVNLLIQIDNLLGISDTVEALIQLTGMKDAFYVNSKTYIHQLYMGKQDIDVESIPKLLSYRDFSDDKEIEGGFNFKTDKGIYRDVVSYDFKSLYSSILINIFASLGEKKLEDYCRNLFKERDKYPKTNPLNNVFKILSNSMYGCFAAKFSSFKNRNIAALITYLGRCLNIYGIQELKKETDICLTSTDSFYFVDFPNREDFVKKMEKRMNHLVSFILNDLNKEKSDFQLDEHVHINNFNDVDDEEQYKINYYIRLLFEDNYLKVLTSNRIKSYIVQKEDEIKFVGPLTNKHTPPVMRSVFERFVVEIDNPDFDAYDFIQKIQRENDNEGNIRRLLSTRKKEGRLEIKLADKNFVLLDEYERNPGKFYKFIDFSMISRRILKEIGKFY